MRDTGGLHLTYCKYTHMDTHTLPPHTHGHGHIHTGTHVCTPKKNTPEIYFKEMVKIRWLLYRITAFDM